MIIGISIFNKRLSPLFDASQNLLLIHWNGKEETGRELIHIGCSKLEKLKEINPDVLICGAVSKCLLRSITNFKINVIPYLCGEYEDILEAYKNGELLNKDDFIMPGCCRRRKGRCNKQNR